MTTSKVVHHFRNVNGKIVPVSEHQRKTSGSKSTDTFGVSERSEEFKGRTKQELLSMADPQTQESEADASQIKMMERQGRPDVAKLVEKFEEEGHDQAQIVYLGYRRENKFGVPFYKGFLLLNTGEPVSKDETLAFLHEKLIEEHGEEVEVDGHSFTFEGYKRCERTGRLELDTSGLPDWLVEENPRVPTQDVLTAAEYFAQKTQGTPLAGKTVVISGDFADDFTEMSRDEAKLFLETQGARVVSSMSKKVDVVIADPDSTTSKVVKGKEAGIPIISPEEAMEYPLHNLAAWRTEQYRRYRLGTEHIFGDTYRDGVSYTTYNPPSISRARTHEEALMAAEQLIQCAHRWTGPVFKDTRGSVLRTGEIQSTIECAVCGKKDTKVERRFY